MSIELTQGRRIVWNWSTLHYTDTRPRIIDTATDTEICALEGHTDMVRGALELQDGRLLTWSNDQTLRVWRMSDGACEAVFRGHQSWVSGAIELWPGVIVSWDGDGWLHRWSTRTGVGRHALAPHNDLSIHDREVKRVVVPGANRLLVVNEKCVRLVNARRFATLRTFDSDDAGNVVPLPPTHFTIISDQGLQIRSIKDGSFYHYCDLDRLGITTRLVALGDQRILVLHGAIPRCKKHVAELLTWSQCPIMIEELEFGGEPVVRIEARANGDVALVLADFRVIVLGTDPLALREAALGSIAPSGLASFDPDCSPLWDADSAPALPPSIGPIADPRRLLQARWLSASEAGMMELEHWSPVAGESIRDGKLLVEPLLGDYEAYEAGEGMQWLDLQSGDCVPASADDAERVARRSSDAYIWTAKKRMVRLRGVDPQALEHALESLGDVRELQRQRWLWLMPAVDGAIVAYQRHPDVAAWWIDRQGTTDLVQILPITIDPAAITAFHGCPLIAPDGTWHAVSQGRLAPLLRPDGSGPVRVVPAWRDQLKSIRWCAGNRIVVINDDGEGVAVHDAADLRRLARLDGGHGLRIRSILELRDGTLATHLRSSLRTWRGSDLQPLAELHDPGEWGPGTETVIPLRHMSGLAFCCGKWSFGTRVVLWDGGTRVLVFGGHADEVIDLMELGDGYMASWIEERDRDTGEPRAPWAIWRIPPEWRFDTPWLT